MKFIVFLSILALSTACVPQGVPGAGPSPTLIATQPASTPFPAPTATPALLLPTPTPIFVSVDSAAIDRQGQLYASGYGAIGSDARHIARWDGEKWITLEDGLQTAGNALAVDRAGHLYTESLKESEQGMGTAIMRWDGATWEDITGNFSSVVDALQARRISSNIPVVALAVDMEDHLYAAGMFYYPSADHTQEFPMGYVAKWDRETWRVLGQGFDKVNILGLAVRATGQVYVSGEQPLTPEGNSSYVAQWDGETWTQINTNPLNSSRHIALDESGHLYVSGPSNEHGEVIAYWDGTNWITITDQLQGEAPAVFDMAADADGHLTIGGSFDSVSGIPARNIAYWDGSAWHGLGEGVNRAVNALALAPNGDLYAVGAFTEAGGVPAHHVARWDGETWHALGP